MRADGVAVLSGMSAIPVFRNLMEFLREGLGEGGGKEEMIDAGSM
jgi:hypothetical protein